jgi:hypothetical protein
VSQQLAHDESWDPLIKIVKEGGEGKPKVVKKIMISQTNLKINGAPKNKILRKLHLL